MKLLELVDDAPVGVADSYETNEDTVLIAQTGVLANDRSPDGTALTARLVAGVSHGTLSLAADGSFTYTPGFFVGDDTFTYSVNSEVMIGWDPATGW